MNPTNPTSLTLADSSQLPTSVGLGRNWQVLPPSMYPSFQLPNMPPLDMTFRGGSGMQGLSTVTMNFQPPSPLLQNTGNPSPDFAALGHRQLPDLSSNKLQLPSSTGNHLTENFYADKGFPVMPKLSSLEFSMGPSMSMPSFSGFGEKELALISRPASLQGAFSLDMTSLMQKQMGLGSPERPLWTMADRAFSLDSMAFALQMNRVHSSTAPVLNLQVTFQLPNAEFLSGAAASPSLDGASMTAQIRLENHAATGLLQFEQNPSAMQLAPIAQARARVADFALGAVHCLQRSLAQMGLAEMDVPLEGRVQIINTMAKFQSDSRINQALTRAFSVSPERQLTFTTSKAINTMFQDLYLRSMEAKQFSFGPKDMPELKVLGDSANGTINFFCGINNNTTSVLEAQAVLYQSFDGQFAIEPHHVHDNSLLHGLSLVAYSKLGADRTVSDVLFNIFTPRTLKTMGEVFMGSPYLPTAVDRQVEQLSATARAIILENNPNLKQVCVTFSHGVTVLEDALRRMPQAYRDTVIAIPVGPTKILDNKLAAEVYTIIGDKDKASLLCNGGLGSVMKKAENSYIRVIPQNETRPVIGGHYATQKEYQKQIKTVIAKEILPKYEIH